MCCGNGCKGCPFMPGEYEKVKRPDVSVDRDDFEMLVMMATDRMLDTYDDHAAGLSAVLEDVNLIKSHDSPEVLQEELSRINDTINLIEENVALGKLDNLVDQLREFEALFSKP